MIEQIPHYRVKEFDKIKNKYCVCIPVINEGGRIYGQLNRLQKLGLTTTTDIILCDGGSDDGSTSPKKIGKLVNTILIKMGPGKLSAQLRMGFAWALSRGYEGIITVDGNGKDDVEAIPSFIQALEEGYDMIQGSRYLPEGAALNTPLIRTLSVKMIHIPVISFASGFEYTDTTNGFRAYSKRYLTHPAVQPFRDIFQTYELLAYLSVRAPQLGLKTKEIPVRRSYPEKGAIPTKISFFKGNYDLFRILFLTLFGKYNP